MLRVRAIAGLVLLSMTLALEAGARDDEEQRAEARRQFDLGTKAFANRRYREAALAFEAACANRPSAIAFYTAGLAWEQASAPDRAADDFARALDTSGLGQAETKEARTRLENLQRTLGLVTVTGTSGTNVALDDHFEAPVPARLHGSPGKHVVVVRYPDDKVDHKVVVLKQGDTVTLDLNVREAPPKAECPAVAVSAVPTQTAPAPIPARKIVGIGLIGAGVAAAGAATVLGLEALGSRDSYNAHPTRESFDHASSLQTATNVAWIAAGVLSAGGIALVLWPRKTESASVEGSVSLLPQPTGVTVRGVW